MAFDFAAVTAPFRMHPGLRRLGPGASHLTPTAAGDRALREKLAVLASYPAEALVSVAGFDSGPALDTLVERALVEHPEAFTREGAATFRAPRLGWALHHGEPAGDGPAEIGACLAALAPEWRLTALLALAFVQDVAVIESDGRIPWIAACLPSNWAPEDKVGRVFTQVHAPVADNAMLLAAAGALADLVTSGEEWERYVWTITDDPRLHRHPRRAPPVRWDSAVDADGLAARAWLRTERQTFLPVAGQRQAVFTIEIEVRPLVDAMTDADAAQRLHASLASMSAAVLAYRGLAPARERLLDWLERRARELEVRRRT
jgi:hypothetical protein